jgi:hypothetical protein
MSRLNYKKIKELLPVFLLACAIALSPAFSIGEIKSAAGGNRAIEIRVEDILLLILGLIWISNFLISRRSKIGKPPLFFPILVWLGVGLIGVLINLIFVNIQASRAFFYFLKEIEFFFLYFYVFYHVKSLNVVRFILKTWVFLALVNVAWIIFELITGLKITYYYGPTIFTEPRGSFPSAGFFLIIFSVLFNVLIYYYLKLNISKFKKVILAISVLSLIIGIFAAASRSNFWGLILMLPLAVFLYLLKEKKIKAFFIPLLVLICVVIVFISVLRDLPSLQRTIDFERIKVARVSIWKGEVVDFLGYNPLFAFFGLGKSVILPSAGQESHSQYMRNFVETGVVGSIAFLFLIFFIIKKSAVYFLRGKDPLLVGLSAGLLVSTVAMFIISIPAEAFIVVKVAEVYWFFAALALVALNIGKKQEN